MNGFGCIGEAAISDIPDWLSGEMAAALTLIGEFDLLVTDPFIELVSDPNRRLVYAVEVFAHPLSDR